VRIIGGERRGQKLAQWQGLRIRPLRDRVRTALFDVLSDVLPGAQFLDLFAGTGAVGLEALSRGARWATFVESAPRAVRLVRENIDRLDYRSRAEVLFQDARAAVRELARRGKAFDLCFIGAPYGTDLGHTALADLALYSPLRDEAIVVLEVHHKAALPRAQGALQLDSARTYGETRLGYYRFVPTDAGT